MKTYTKFIQTIDELNTAGGKIAGKLELVSTPIDKILAFANSIFKDGIVDYIPDFVANYKRTQKIAKLGTALRKDMPVIDNVDVSLLQQRLKQGELDIHFPYSKNTSVKNPFPEGLTGKEAHNFLSNGMKKNDGDANDDKVNVKMVKIVVGKLKPIQQQIYADKSLELMFSDGSIENTIDWLINDNIFIVSSDNNILDGHHRWLSANLIDRTLQVNCLVVDLPLKILLPLTKSYGDAIGNKRNA